VGKTTLAAACATRLADRGRRTLLVSTDPAHSTSDALGVQVGSAPGPVGDHEHLEAVELDPDAEADAYIRDVKDRIEEAAPPRIAQEAMNQIDAARGSPGAVEAALFDRFTVILNEHGRRFDRILFDTAPTGQTLRLLTLPEVMTEWMTNLIRARKKVRSLARMWGNVALPQTDQGPARKFDDDLLMGALVRRRDRFKAVRSVLTDRERTSFVFVLTPEHLPVAETERAVGALAKAGIPVGPIITNQILPPLPDGARDDAFTARRLARQSRYLERIRGSFGGGAMTLLGVMMQEEEAVGLEALRRMEIRRLSTFID